MPIVETDGMCALSEGGPILERGEPLAAGIEIPGNSASPNKHNQKIGELAKE